MDNLIFDLDNTIYSPQKNVLLEVDRRINDFMKKRLCLTEVDDLRKRYRDEWGTTLLGLINDFGVVPEDYLEFVHDIDYDLFLQKDHRLSEILSSFESNKIIFTNGSKKHAENVLDRLGVASHFNTIFSIESFMMNPKPFPEAYEIFIRNTGIDPFKSVYFEDSHNNLKAAKKFGFKTALVWGSDSNFDYSFANIYDIISLKGV